MEKEKKDKAYITSLTPFQKILSSGSGAVLTSVMMTPFDVVKVRLQAQQQAVNMCYNFCKSISGATCYCTIHGLPMGSRKFTGTMDTFYKIGRYEGITSLWRGAAPAFLMSVPQTIIYFTMYESLKMKFGFEPGSQNNFWSPAFAGGISRTLAVIAVCPIELVRTKMQSRIGYNYRTLAAAVRVAVQEHGVLSLWRGLEPMLIRDVPFSMFYWLALEKIKHHLMFTFDMPYSPIIPIIASSTAGTIAAIATNPLDVIKTHMQMEIGEGEFYGSKALGRGSACNVMRSIIKEHGIRGLYAGLIPRCFKIAPACAVMLTSFELSKTYFSRRNMLKSTQ